MLKNSVFMPWVAICGSHNENTLKLTEKALTKTFQVYKKALTNNNPRNFIKGHIVKPVFRKYN